MRLFMNKRIIDLKIERVVNKVLYEKGKINQTQYKETLNKIDRLIFEENQVRKCNK